MISLRSTFVVILALVTASAGLGCRSRSREVVVYLSIDQVFTEPILRDFERQSGVKVRAVFDTEETKSTGVLNRIVAEAASPQADVFWSGDPVRPVLLVKRGLVRPYVSPNAAAVPPAFKAADGSWTGRRRAGAPPPREPEPREAGARCPGPSATSPTRGGRARPRSRTRSSARPPCTSPRSRTRGATTP